MIKGALGRLLLGFSSTLITLYSAFSRLLTAALAWASFTGLNGLPACLATSKRNSDSAFLTSAWISQNSSGINALISRSRSTSKRTATDCTRPAESPRATFAHSKGDTIKPTTRSKKRRVCCAYTISVLSSPGVSNACWIAFFVISLKTTRLYFAGSPPIISWRCQAIASPSLSKSVARYIWSAFSASFLSSCTTFSFPGSIS